MASNTSEKETIDESMTKDRNERSQELSSVALDVPTTEEELTQKCTSSIEGQQAKADQTTHIDNNDDILFVYLPTSEALDALNVTIDNNFGDIIVGEDVKCKFYVQSGKTTENLKANNNETKRTPSDELRLIFNGYQQSKSMYWSQINRSEFCLAWIYTLPSTSRTIKRENVSGTSNDSKKERTQKLSREKTVEPSEQACTSSTIHVVMVKSHAATKVQTLHIGNNYGTIVISANASKCSDIGAHSTKQKANTFNIKATNNVGSIIAGENIQLIVKDEEDKKDAPLYQLRPIVDQSINDCLVNRSEFCPASIFDPYISEEM